MNGDEQRTHKKVVAELAADTASTFEAVIERFEKLETTESMNHASLLLEVGKLRKWMLDIELEEQRGRDLFAQMIDGETQYRKAHIAKVGHENHQFIEIFVSKLTFWQRLRWLFWGSPIAVPKPKTIVAQREDASDYYYGEKPR